MDRGRQKRRVTLLLDEEITREMRVAVERGHARSQSAFVQDAVAEYLGRRRSDELRKAYGEAARDPRFLEDVRAIERDFESSDEELGER